jgi:hypothetical protein
MRNRITIKTNTIIVLAGIIVLSLSMAAQADEDSYTLLIQSSPPDGGTVTPGIGVHSITMNETIQLSAKAKPGYRFMYWLGDVSSTSGVDTSVSIDSPKLVVAVFSREGFDEGLPDTEVIDGQRGAGGGGRGINPMRSPGSVNPGYSIFDGFDFPTFEPITPTGGIYRGGNGDGNGNGDDGDDIPVPGDIDDIPVPGDGEVPEPATILILGLGATVFLKQRR